MDKRAVKEALINVLCTLLLFAVVCGGFVFLIWMCLDATRAKVLCAMLCAGGLGGLFYYYYYEALKEFKDNEDFDKKQTDILIEIVESQLQLGMNVDFVCSTGYVRIYGSDGDPEKYFLYRCPFKYKNYFIERFEGRINVKVM